MARASGSERGRRAAMPAAAEMASGCSGDHSEPTPATEKDGFKASAAAGQPTLADALWAAYRAAPRPKPCSKELVEAFAFMKKVEPLLFKRKRSRSKPAADQQPAPAPPPPPVGTALDVCGGHAILALLLLIYRKAARSIVLDIDSPRSFGTMVAAWTPWLPAGVGVEVRHGDIHDTLPVLLTELNAGQSLRSPPAPASVTICAIHACDFLTDLVIDAAISSRAAFAVMPCCHKDRHRGQLRQAARSLAIDLGAVVDIVRMGKVWDRDYGCVSI